MARIKYYYDTETCKYERVKTKTSDVVLNALGLLAMVCIVACILVWGFYKTFESPKELILKNENKELKFYLEKVSSELDVVKTAVENVEHRDDNIYRVVLGAEPIDKSIRNAGVGGVDRYIDIKNKN